MLKNKINILKYIAIAIICIFLSCLAVDYDYDLFARLIVGERFVEYGILPFKDFLSYTPTHPWYDHEWGSGVIFYVILKYLGPMGFILFQATIMFLISVFVIKIQKLQKHPFPTSLMFFSLFLFIFMKLNPSLVRCQLFSFLFFTVFMYILELTRKDKSKKIIWLIPIITVFWNNVHGGIVSGLGLITMYTIGAILEKKHWKKYVAVLFTSFLALIINPYGIKYLGFLFSAATKNRKYVVEWWPFFAKRHIWYYLSSCLYATILWCISAIEAFRKKHIDYTKFIILSVTLYFGLAHVKLLPLAVISATAFCYNDIARLCAKYKKCFTPIENSILLAILILGLYIPFFSPNYARVTQSKFPIYEIEFIKLNKLKGNIVVPFGYGSYASYKLYPDNLIYMDGRYEEVYNDKEFTVLRDFELVEDNWQDIINNYPTEILMPSIYTDVYEKLENDPNWVKLYTGLKCAIFVKKGQERDSYLPPEYDITYYKKTMFKHGEFKND